MTKKEKMIGRPFESRDRKGRNRFLENMKMKRRAWEKQERRREKEGRQRRRRHKTNETTKIKN